MEKKFNIFILIGMLLGFVAYVLIPYEAKYIKAIVAVIGAILVIIGFVKKKK